MNATNGSPATPNPNTEPIQEPSAATSKSEDELEDVNDLVSSSEQDLAPQDLNARTTTHEYKTQTLLQLETYVVSDQKFCIKLPIFQD
jgi:hypothetical protein